jgi:hypothetical protein
MAVGRQREQKRWGMSAALVCATHLGRTPPSRSSSGSARSAGGRNVCASGDDCQSAPRGFHSRKTRKRGVLKEAPCWRDTGEAAARVAGGRQR